jgi:adenine-specific DNA-methyltransferase
MRLALPPSSCKIYTPAALADAMVAALGDRPHFCWLEPSHGKGAFLEALRRRKIDKKRILAVDLDPAPAPADKLATTLRSVDFLRWATRTNRRFDRIVGNPPFVSISQLPVSLARTAAAIPDLANRPIGKGANVWYAFVLASLRLLNHGGSLAFVLPSSAEFTDYSAAIRSAVRDQFEKLELYRSNRPLFQDAQEGSLVVIARNYLCQPFRIVRRRLANRAELIAALSKSGKVNGRPCPGGSFNGNDGTVTFGSIADIRLGGVTGDARYFLMNDETRRRLKLPAAACTRVVSRARHLKSPFIDKQEWEELKENGERIWLFNPSKAITNLQAVKKYLRRRSDGCNRDAFKITHRKPWYRTPLPSSPHAFLSGMSQFGPWLCLNEMPALNATNTLYVALFKNADENQRYGYALALLTTGVRRQLRRAGRRYPDGLVKYEPSALAGLRIPLLKEKLVFRTLYVRAFDALLTGKPAEARSIADSVFAR